MFLCARTWVKHHWASWKCSCWAPWNLGRVLMDSDENPRWLWAGYISQTSCASPHCSSILSVILCKVHKHGTHAVQTSYLFSVNDPHHQVHNGAQFPRLFLFPFPPTLLLFITSKCDLYHADCKICGPANSVYAFVQHPAQLDFDPNLGPLLWTPLSVVLLSLKCTSIYISHGLKNKLIKSMVKHQSEL